MMRVRGGSFLRTSPRVDAAQTPRCRSMFWSRPRRVRARGHEHDRASARYTLGRYLAGPHATAVPGGPPTRRRRVRERRRGRVAALVYSLVSRRFVRMKSRGIHQRHMNGGEGNECGNHRRQSASRRRRPSGRRAFTPSSERSLREMISRCVRSRVMYVAARVTIRRARRDRRAPLPPWIISVPWRTCALSPSRSCAAAARQSQPRCERPPARADDSRWSGVARSSRDER